MQPQITLAKKRQNVGMLCLHQRIALLLRLVHLPALTALGSNRNIKFCHIVCTNLGPFRMHLLTFKGGIIDQSQSINSNIQALGDLGHGGAFRCPRYLGIEEIIRNAERPEDVHSWFKVVLAGDRLDNPAPIQFLHRFQNLRIQLQRGGILCFNQCPVP